jgi:opacity protein-like surface antigen
MKKLSLGLFAVLGVLFSANAFAASGNGEFLAPTREGKWDWGIGIAGAMNDSGTDDSVFISTAVAYGVTPYIGLGVEAGWQEADSESATDRTVGVVPVLFDIILRLPTVHDQLVPYGVLGLGAAGVYVDTNDRDDVDDTAFTWKLGAGADWFIKPNWILNFEFAFWNAGVELPAGNLNDDFEWWTIGLSLKYVF